MRYRSELLSAQRIGFNVYLCYVPRSIYELVVSAPTSHISLPNHFCRLYNNWQWKWNGRKKLTTTTHHSRDRYLVGADLRRNAIKYQPHEAGTRYTTNCGLIARTKLYKEKRQKPKNCETIWMGSERKINHSNGVSLWCGGVLRR